MSSPESLEHVFEAGALTIRLRNTDILYKMEPTIARIAELIETRRPGATLIDFRDVPAPSSFIERYQLGELAGRYLANRLIAVLLRLDQADRQQIGKVVALNRGALIEVFTEAAPAEAWLQKHAKPDPAP